jgi:hypothetical protein
MASWLKELIQTMLHRVRKVWTLVGLRLDWRFLAESRSVQILAGDAE